MNKIRVFIVDDHPIVRFGVKQLISTQPDMEVIGEAGDGETAFQQIREVDLDVVLMDIAMPNLNGAQTTERLKVVCPALKVLALSAYQDETHMRLLLEAGASGYVWKKSIVEELPNAIRTVARGGVYLEAAGAAKMIGDYISGKGGQNLDKALSPREREVMIQIARGYSNKEIALQLHLSVKTIEGNKERIMHKLDLNTRADIVRFALREGWLHSE